MNEKLENSNKKIKFFDPKNLEESLLGWLLHAHKGRNRHDLAARRYDKLRIWLGGTAVVVSSIVATSASILATVPPTSENIVVWIKIIAAVLGTLSAILVGLTTFLNLAERVEKHRSAGVQYKEAIRELERILSGISLNNLANTDQPIILIQSKLDELEKTAPVVPEAIYDQVESNMKNNEVVFVSTANKLID